MSNHSQQAPDTLPLWREAYPGLDEAQLLEAREHFRAYLTVVLRIHDRLEAERLVKESAALDGLKPPI